MRELSGVGCGQGWAPARLSSAAQPSVAPRAGRGAGSLPQGMASVLGVYSSWLLLGTRAVFSLG